MFDCDYVHTLLRYEQSIAVDLFTMIAIRVSNFLFRLVIACNISFKFYVGTFVLCELNSRPHVAFNFTRTFTF